MPRTVRNLKIDSPSARARLVMRREPYWTVITKGCALGYRKGAKGGTWVARFRNPATGKQRYMAIGAADDVMDADVEGAFVVSSYRQAEEAAREWFAQQGRRNAGVGYDGTFTVAQVMDGYFEWFEQNRANIATVKSHIDGYIKPELGTFEAAKLTSAQIREFHDLVAKSPARVRTRPGQPQRHKSTPKSKEEKRQRQVSANKVLSTLKAGLNRAFADGKLRSDEAWRRVKPYPNVEAARIRYLNDDECARLVNACETDFRRLVQAALLSGARYGEITRLTAADYNPDAGSIFIEHTKSGRPRHVYLTDEGKEFFERATAGQAPGDLIFFRSDTKCWDKSQQARPLLRACNAAGVSPAITFHILRHSYASRLAMRGVPMAVIAEQLGHADDRLVQKHYAHLSKTYVATAVRAASTPLGIIDSDNVERLKVVNRPR